MTRYKRMIQIVAIVLFVYVTAGSLSVWWWFRTHTSSLCPPMQIFADENGNGVWDNEPLLDPVNLPGAEIEIVDEGGKVLVRAPFPCGIVILPTRTSETLTLRLIPPPGFTVTTAPHTLQAAFLMDAYVTFGVRRLP